MDRRVVDMPWILRWILVHGIIANFRSGKSAKAYQKVWLPQGSPLRVYSEKFRDELESVLSSQDIKIFLGMRYGSPSMQESFSQIRAENFDRIIVAPMFPQYASSSWGSAMERVYELVSKEANARSLHIIPPFFDQSEFIDAWAKRMREAQYQEYDLILFSYHGLPERHIKRCAKTCLQSTGCCEKLDAKNQFCYRAHCFETTRLIQKVLDLDNSRIATSFQSRLGRTPWIKPYTDKLVLDLLKQKKKRILVCPPSFVVDCLETLEEIEIRLREDFLAAGGERLEMVKSLNADLNWVEGFAKIVGRHKFTK